MREVAGSRWEGLPSHLRQQLMGLFCLWPTVAHTANANTNIVLSTVNRRPPAFRIPHPVGAVRGLPPIGATTPRRGGSRTAPTHPARPSTPSPPLHPAFPSYHRYVIIRRVLIMYYLAEDVIGGLARVLGTTCTWRWPAGAFAALPGDVERERSMTSSGGRK